MLEDVLYIEHAHKTKNGITLTFNRCPLDHFASIPGGVIKSTSRKSKKSKICDFPGFYDVDALVEMLNNTPGKQVNLELTGFTKTATKTVIFKQYTKKLTFFPTAIMHPVKYSIDIPNKNWKGKLVKRYDRNSKATT